MASKKPVIKLSHGNAVDPDAAASFIASGRAGGRSDAVMPRQKDAQTDKHRTMIYLPKVLFRKLKVRCAETDEPMTGFIERAVKDLLEREAGT